MWRAASWIGQRSDSRAGLPSRPHVALRARCGVRRSDRSTGPICPASPVASHPAKNILRAARATTYAASNAKVARDLGKIARGKKLPPILLVRGDAARDLPLIVADGMHRLSAAWHQDESADVACVVVDRPKK